MHDLYALKTMLCDKLKDYGAKGDLNATSLNTVDMLAHACKNVCKIIDWCESRSDDEGSSYARGRGARRDAMGRYSRDAETDEHTKEKLREMIDRL